MSADALPDHWTCAGCRAEIEVGDRFIKDTPAAFMGKGDDGLNGLMADIMGGVGTEIVYCEDCTQEGDGWKLETYYGPEETSDAC